MENSALYDMIRSLPIQVKEEVVDFMEFLLEKSKKRIDLKRTDKQGDLKGRKLGLLESKATFKIKENFKMTEEELISL